MGENGMGVDTLRGRGSSAQDVCTKHDYSSITERPNQTKTLLLTPQRTFKKDLI